MDNTQVDSQRAITFTTAQDKRRPDKINKSATIFLICELRKLLLDKKIELPEGLVRTLVVLPTIQSNTRQTNTEF